MSLFGNILGGIIGSNSNKSALRAQQAAANKATDVQERMYNQSREDLAPYREAGTAANNQLSYLLGITPDSITTMDGNVVDPYAKVNKDLGGYGSLSKRFTLDNFYEDPGYQYSLEKGNKAINAAQSARGNLYSGKALKEATDYNRNEAANQYETVRNRYNQDQDSLYNRLTGVSNSGQGATNTGVSSNQNNADALGNIYGNLGNAKAASKIRQGNIWSEVIANSDPFNAKSGSSYGSLSSFFM